MKRAHKPGLILASFLLLASCSENPATGQRQFSGLMPASQEASVGATEHQKAIAEYGLYGDSRVQSYVSSVGQKLIANAERSDVQWKFTVLDSPVINAFALPGGYVYVTRGLMAWANNEAELAGVLAHEIGHVNARHSAARYSQAAVAQLGLGVLGAVTNQPLLNQAAGVGANLYLSRYSQTQEYEADSLGIRYLTGGGYDPLAMSGFLQQLNRNDAYEAAYKGRSSGGGLNQFFSDHPSTPARVQRTANEAASVPGGSKAQNAAAYLQAIDGLVYGDNAATDGIIQGTKFTHPGLGFTFSAPSGFVMQNSKEAVLARHPSGVTMLFDTAAKQSGQSIRAYYDAWAQGLATNVQNTTIGGLQAVTGMIPQASMNGQAVAVRTVAIQADADTVYRFQYAMPPQLANDANLQRDIMASAQSFRLLAANERQVAGGQRIRIVTASSSDTVDSMAAKMGAGSSAAEKRALFMALNGMDGAQALQTGRGYKIVQ